MTSLKSAITFVICYVLFALPAYFLQTQMLFSSDVAYLIHTANILLAGGKYVSDIFETNPPLIMYLYFPVCWIMKLTALDMMLVLRIYILFLTFISSSLCFYLLKKLIRPEDKSLFYFLICMLWVIFLFAPVFELGQKENFLTLFMMPYVFIVAAKLENKHIPASLSIFIGTLAGLGFALKPFFLIPVCLIELYVIWKKRNLFAWIRSETLAIAGVTIIYLITLIIFHPTYIQTIVPLLPWYFASAKESWRTILTCPFVIFNYVALISYFLFYAHDRYRTLNTITWLALLGMTLAYLIPQSPWFYHTLPALSLAYLLFANVLGQILPNWGNTQFTLKHQVQQTVFFLGLFSLIYAVPVYNTISFSYRVLNSVWHDANIKVAEFINSQPGKHRIYCFTTSGTCDCFPLVNLTNSEFSGRFPFFWWVSILNAPPTPKTLAEKKYLIGIITDDLSREQPSWVIVNNRTEKQQLLSQFETLDKNFQQTWKKYSLLTNIGHYQIYKRES